VFSHHAFIAFGGIHWQQVLTHRHLVSLYGFLLAVGYLVSNCDLRCFVALGGIAAYLAIHPLGCLFLFDRNLFWGLKNSKKRIPEDFFFPCVFRRIFSQERGFGGSFRNSCFSLLSQEFFAGIPARQDFLHLQRIPLDSSGFLRIPPDSCSRQMLSGSGQQLK
jgi:hypothetical protein